MTKYLSLIIVLLILSLSVAADRGSSDCDSTADFDDTSGVTFTTGGNGYCGEAVIIDSNSDVAAWFAQGMTHCDSSDVASYAECSSAGDQINTGTLQFWFNCDTDGDGTCNGSSAYSANWFSRSNGSKTPTVLKYDGSAPYNTIRTYDGASQHTLTGATPFDGSWHKIYYTWDIANNNRKLCVDSYCSTSTDLVIAYAAGSTDTVGFRVGADTDMVFGAYDEFQLSDVYDGGFASDGPGCSSYSEALSVSDSHALGTVIDTTGTTCYLGCDYKVRLYGEYDDSSSSLWGEWTLSSGSNSKFHAWFPAKREGKDDTDAVVAGVDLACDGWNTGDPDTCCNWGTSCTTAPTWGSNWARAESPPLQSDWWDQDGDGDGDGSGDYLTHRGRTMIYTDFAGWPDKTDDTAADNLDPDNTAFDDSNCVSGGCPIISSGLLQFDGDETNVFAITEENMGVDQFVSAYIDCSSCSASTQDHIMNLRRASGGSSGLYQCKFEFFGGTNASAKWNMVDATGYPAGACADVDMDQVGLSDSLPKWARCEVWTDDDDGDGDEEAHAAIWMASDNSGAPGEWTFVVELRHEEGGAAPTCITGEAGATWGACPGSGCSAWTGKEPILTDGRAAWGVAKSANHTFDKIMAGRLVTTPRARGRRAN